MYCIFLLLTFLFVQEPVSDVIVEALIRKTQTASVFDLPGLFQEITDLKDNAEPAIPVLIDFLSDDRSSIKALISDDTSVAREASDALIELGPIAVPKLTEKIALTDSSESRAYAYAFMALYRIGHRSIETQTAIEEILKKTDDYDVRWWAIYTLGAIAIDEDRALQTLKVASEFKSGDEDRDVEFQRIIAKTLGRLEGGSNAVVQMLLKMTEHESCWVQANAVDSLVEIAEWNSDIEVRIVELMDFKSGRKTNIHAAVAHARLSKDVSKGLKLLTHLASVPPVDLRVIEALSLLGSEFEEASNPAIAVLERIKDDSKSEYLTSLATSGIEIIKQRKTND